MRNRIAPLALAVGALFGGAAFLAVGALFGGYVTKVYFENGGNKLVVASGGEIEVQSGGTLDVQSGTLLPALDAYALLAGDEDGQVIQGIAGENKAKLDIGTIAQLRGEGAAPGYVQANGAGAYLSSADESTYLDLYDGVIEFSTDGVLSASADVVRIISGQTPPTNANDACTAGDTIDTATFHYFCAATNTWVRVALATWP